MCLTLKVHLSRDPGVRAVVGKGDLPFAWCFLGASLCPNVPVDYIFIPTLQKSKLMLRNLTNLLKAIQIAKETGGIKTGQQGPRSVHHSLTLFSG